MGIEAEGGYVDQSCKPLIRLRLQLSQYGKANNSDTALWTLSEAGTREAAGSPNQQPLDFSPLIFKIGKWPLLILLAGQEFPNTTNRLFVS